MAGDDSRFIFQVILPGAALSILVGNVFYAWQAHRLAAQAGTIAGELPVALQKRLELARAVATGPRLVVLDEALSGLTPAETQEALAVVRALRERGIALLVVEHVMEVIMTVSDRVVVLDRGRRIAEGPPEAIAHDARVIEAYLGA